VREILILGAAGGLGTIGRYAISGWAYRWLGERFAWGTLAVNVAGCLLIGFLMELGLSSEALGRQTRLALTVGFLGALTTFSTFSYETLRYVEDGAYGLALANTAANLLLGLLATWGGLMAARALLGGA